MSIVFHAKDYDDHKTNPNELLDNDKRYGWCHVSTPATCRSACRCSSAAGADVSCASTLPRASASGRSTPSSAPNYGEVKVGAGNVVVDAGGFPLPCRLRCRLHQGRYRRRFPSASSPERPRGIGRGRATALIDVRRAATSTTRETGVYVPTCAPTAVSFYDYHMTLAPAMGAELYDAGRYFAR